MLHLVDEFGVLQKGLGWYASPVEADAAQSADAGAVVLLDDGYAEAELGGSDCGVITARSGADNYDIEDGF